MAGTSPAMTTELLIPPMQLREQAIKAGADIAPIGQPVARKAERDHVGADGAFLHAGTGHGASWPRAAGVELLRIAAEIDQILALIRRAGAKRQNGKSV